MSHIIGIDLGTTNSSMAGIVGGELRIIPNDRGAHSTPSMVCWLPDGTVLVGESARNQAMAFPEATIKESKRVMGRKVRLPAGKKTVGPLDVASLILTKLKTDASAFLGEEIKYAIITVPAHFDEAARKATIDAAKKAGLEIKRLLNEPTAAAMSHARQLGEKQKILVYDLGGGTFDVSILEKTGDRYIVRASAGDEHLGGCDFDRMVYENARSQIQSQYGLDMDSNPGLRWQLMQAAESAKIELSTREKTRITLPFISHEGKAAHIECDISREMLEGMILSMVQRSIALCSSALREAELLPQDIDAIIFSGGSSRIPLVQQSVRSLVPAPHVHGLNPDEAVALGAAFFADLMQKGQAGLLEDVSSWNLGLEVDSGAFLTLLPRNSALPHEVVRQFTTVEDDQDEVEIHLLQGDERIAHKNRSLGRFLLSGIERGPKGTARIEVRLSLDQNGMALVEASDHKSGSHQRLSVHMVTEAENNIDPAIMLTQLQTLVDELIDKKKNIPGTLRTALLEARNRQWEAERLDEACELLRALLVEARHHDE